MRVWSALLCALFVVAQLASFAHEAFNSHVVCAEHGELIHVDRPALALADHGAHAASHQLLGVSDSRAPRDHEHCGLAAANRERTLELHVQSSVAIAPADSPASIEVRRTEDRSSIPLFLLAPKQSPPA